MSVSKVNWITRRYKLPDFESSAFEAALKNWLQGFGYYTFGLAKFDLLQSFRAKAYSLAKSRLGALLKFKAALYVGYRDGVLYVFSTSDLPTELSGIFDQFFAAFASGKGGEWINETPIAFTTSIFAVSPLSYLLNSLNVDYSLHVNVDLELKKIEASTEAVSVPPGVSVSIKRSRTIKHSVEFTESSTKSGELEAGLKIASIDVLKATVKTEVQNQSGRSWEESETIDYQVNLSGDKCANYRLSWTDLMRVGTVEIRQNDQTKIFPFSCREGTEMEIIPVAPAALEGTATPPAS